MGATAHDTPVWTDGDVKYMTWWFSKYKVTQEDIIHFVAHTLKMTTPGKLQSYHHTAHNISLTISFRDGRIAIIRFPKPGKIASIFMEEKVRNEVQVLDFLREKTTIPVPRVYSWGMTKDSPRNIGPFVILEHVEGETLCNMLPPPTTTNPGQEVLSPNHPQLAHIYEQIADYMLQVAQFDFTAIGAISKSLSGEWTASNRPLTSTMNDLATSMPNYPIQDFPTHPFKTTDSYLQHPINKHPIHTQTQHNLSSSSSNQHHHHAANNTGGGDGGPFKLTCHHAFRPTNLIARLDHTSHRLTITGFHEFDFVNTMPVQFTFDPPSWLAGTTVAGRGLGEGHQADAFKQTYERFLHIFLTEMERVEARWRAKGRRCDVLLSARMREAWARGGLRGVGEGEW